ncbi:hydrogenase maturation protease [Dictyoglomus thermophilum]|uniref:HoxW protein n=2 Tax=Dictyoglomus thermophilum TaxID=14 RepID=B5YB70_DICT6|nr:hydrogenase maturation protease [Dictyoglomus thermophilum]ACI18875.1 HoxW protein [Dictyoglomus thermophilum H-6-12]MCX7720647.1 hydrogenase maturation protease [Dictyoglomus thermophilum]
MKILLVGFGNPYRRDDGLGIKLLDLINYNVEKMKVQELSFDMAEILKDYDMVIFVDASLEGDEISFRKIQEESTFSPLTHHTPCEELLSWTRVLYGKTPEFYLLSIRGYDFDFGEELSDKAKENLEKALEFIKGFLESIS